MITEERQEQATLYVLGALPPADREAFETCLRADSELNQFVRKLQRTTELLALAVPQVKPPRELRQKVLARIDAAATTSRSDVESTAPARATKPGFKFHDASDPSGWRQLPLRGAWIKLLSIEKEKGYAVVLGRLEAGVQYPAHVHAGAEDLYILTGDLHVGDRRLGPGDFHHSDAGTSHAINYSKEGCTLLAVLSLEHELAQFAMASD